MPLTVVNGIRLQSCHGCGEQHILAGQAVVGGSSALSLMVHQDKL